MEDVLTVLASSALDTSKRSERLRLLEQAVDLCKEDHCEALANATVPDCSSVHAARRIAELYSKAFQEARDDDVQRLLVEGLCSLLSRHDTGTKLNPSILASPHWRNMAQQSESNLVALALTLDTVTHDVDAKQQRAEGLETFMQQAFGVKICSPLEIRTCRRLVATLSSEEWNNIVLPVVAKKLKATPEKVVETCEVLVECLGNDIHTDSAGLLDLVGSLVRQLKSTKETLRSSAARALVQVSKRNSATEVAVGIVGALSTLAQNEARQLAYDALTEIYKASSQKNDEVTAPSQDGLDTILTSITTALSKELKTATAPRQAGVQALVAWMAVAKRSGTSGSGYRQALTYLTSPLESSNGPDTVQRMGALFLSVNPDLQESLILDIFGQNGTKVEQGLQDLVDNAVKKRTSVASVEGLVALHLVTVNAIATQSKLKPTFLKALSTNLSFLYSASTTDALETNPLVRQLLPHTIALFVKYTAKQDAPEFGAAAARAMACCIANPVSATSILSTVQTVLTYSPKAQAALGDALFQHINAACLETEERLDAQNASRQSRETFSPETDYPKLIGKGHGNPTASHMNFDSCAVHQVAHSLMVFASKSSMNPTFLTKMLLLMHIMTTKSTSTRKRRQRKALVKHTLQIITDHCLSWDDDQLAELADSVLHACNNADNGDTISGVVHKAATSLIISLGNIGSLFDPSIDDAADEDLKPHCLARAICSEKLSVRLNTFLESALDRIDELTESDVSLFMSQMGTLWGDGAAKPCGADDVKATNADKKRASGKRTKGMDGYSFEDEEWERQMKKELAAKKKDAPSSGTSNVNLTPSEKKQVEEQDNIRRRIGAIVDVDFVRAAESIAALCQSDIEVGNACLPVLGTTVLRAAITDSIASRSLPRLRRIASKTLASLAACVFEIDEEFAPKITSALIVSCKWTPPKSVEGSMPTSPLAVSQLPSHCDPVAVVISEIDEYGDALSGTSFAFLFPIVRAALTGPRTPAGCEGALRVLERQTSMLVGDETDSNVKALRKDMASAILELLSHDRSQTFTNPTPFEALVACYATDTNTDGPALTTAELAPLLGEHGTLGNKNCRVGALTALATIASNHPKLVKNNPLVENRIWMNCFAKNAEIQTAAYSAWKSATSSSSDQVVAPSVMYAISLLPLLSHPDSSISEAAAMANAKAMGLLPPSVDRNIQKLCSTYIDAYIVDGEKKSSAPTAMAIALPPKNAPSPAVAQKKKISTGLPKKKVVPKQDALSIMGKPKVGGRVQGNQYQEENEAEKDTPEKVAVRLGMLSAIGCIADSSAKVSVEISTLKLVTGFLMAYGLADINDDVRSAARNALRDIVATFGASDDAIAFLLPMLEGVLSAGILQSDSLESFPADKIIRNTAAANRRKEGAVVALGSVALHLKGTENEEKIDSTIDMLIATLSTPNESVQSSVAECLAKLMKKGRTQERVEILLNGLLRDCLYGETAAQRKGAAYGLSAVIKGSGIACLKKFDVVKKLEDAADSGSQSNKEGSLFAIELLSSRLGLLFEPYVIVLLPSLLKSFSDSSDHVRAAAASTAGLIMSKLSAHGVKLVMPAVLTAFDDPAWRTKQASIQMLGSMSHLAPKQLASALPKVVPKLTEAFSDTHPKVKASAQEALEEISKVVKNPEISSISTVLLSALTDPSEGTIKALESLIETEFLHAIDAPSLALIVPILHRGLRDRVATTKRYGALIAGNICTMINDPKDFLPYLPILLPDLQLAMLDPIPDVRSTSAKAVGSLTRGLGEDSLPDLRAWLLEKLRDQGVTSAERSGAAQGLTELLVAGGAQVVEEVMKDEILPLRSHPQASTREGVLWVLTFLPSSLGQSFTPLIDVSLPALIGGLSDESEPVRDVAMRAGRVMIRSHGKDHVDKILPSLEKGLTDEDHRIRVASLTLLGDLLSMIGGTSVVKGDGDTQDDLRKAEKAQAQIALALGTETRKRVLSGLYLARSDTTSVVRQSAVQVWKTVVSVTARSLRDILPVLVSKIVEALASGHSERTQVAGRCLGDIVHKLGDSVQPEIIPVLRNALYSGDRHTRRGVCVGLSEVISCSTKEQILKFIEIIVKAVQDALCDDDEGVRQMAASCFRSLHNVVGNRALDEIVPSLLFALDNGEDNASRSRALNGLIGILSIRSKELLPYIIPRLIKAPISVNHARALAGIAEVTGSTLHMHFHSIIPTLIAELSECSDEARGDSIRECARSICGNAETAGVNWLISEIASKAGSDKPDVRRQSCWMFQVVVEERKDEADFYDQIPIILRELLYRFNDDNASVLKGNYDAFSALSTNVPAEELVKHVEFIRNLISSMVSDARRRKGGVGDGEFLMPGFNIPKGLEPLLPIYQRGILYGTPAIREASAAGLGELISYTSSKFLAGQLIIKITGPLLRIVGDRNPPEVKVAILRTLGMVLVKGGPALRAFVPQFQTTFVKALSDQSRQVRVEAIKALALLMPLSTRVDPLLKELVSGSLGKAGDEGGIAAVQTATLEALSTVLKEGGSKAKLPDSIPSALGASIELLKHEDEGVREAAAKVMGVACSLLGPETTVETITDVVLSTDDDSAEIRHGKACASRRIMSSAGPLIPEDLAVKVTDLLIAYTKDDKMLVKEAACSALGAALGSATQPEARLRKIEPVLLAIMNSTQERMEVHKAVASGLCVALTIAKTDNKVTLFGKNMMDACLQLAMSGSQRVQYAFNDVLWIALSVGEGDAGLESYLAIANFDNSKAMKALQSKVLSRIKSVEVDI
ncbi:HEAT repeat [Fragilaria crotonensis]|nr:HEAT repeat [Fragilaria crotonensis]